jgi:hypothetical protein
VKGFLAGSLALIVLYTLLESSDKLAGANNAIANLVHNLLSGEHAAIHVHAPAPSRSGSSAPAKTPPPSSGTPPILV